MDADEDAAFVASDAPLDSSRNINSVTRILDAFDLTGSGNVPVNFNDVVAEYLANGANANTESSGARYSSVSRLHLNINIHKPGPLLPGYENAPLCLRIISSVYQNPYSGSWLTDSSQSYTAHIALYGPTERNAQLQLLETMLSGCLRQYAATVCPVEEFLLSMLQVMPNEDSSIRRQVTKALKRYEAFVTAENNPQDRDDWEDRLDTRLKKFCLKFEKWVRMAEKDVLFRELGVYDAAIEEYKYMPHPVLNRWRARDILCGWNNETLKDWLYCFTFDMPRAVFLDMEWHLENHRIRGQFRASVENKWYMSNYHSGLEFVFNNSNRTLQIYMKPRFDLDKNLLVTFHNITIEVGDQDQRQPLVELSAFVISDVIDAFRPHEEAVMIAFGARPRELFAGHTHLDLYSLLDTGIPFLDKGIADYSTRSIYKHVVIRLFSIKEHTVRTYPGLPANRQMCLRKIILEGRANRVVRGQADCWKFEANDAFVNQVADRTIKVMVKRDPCDTFRFQDNYFSQFRNLFRHILMTLQYYSRSVLIHYEFAFIARNLGRVAEADRLLGALHALFGENAEGAVQDIRAHMESILQPGMNARLSNLARTWTAEKRDRQIAFFADIKTLEDYFMCCEWTTDEQKHTVTAHFCMDPDVIEHRDTGDDGIWTVFDQLGMFTTYTIPGSLHLMKHWIQEVRIDVTGDASVWPGVTNDGPGHSGKGALLPAKLQGPLRAPVRPPPAKETEKWYLKEWPKKKPVPRMSIEPLSESDEDDNKELQVALRESREAGQGAGASASSSGVATASGFPSSSSSNSKRALPDASGSSTTTTTTTTTTSTVPDDEDQQADSADFEQDNWDAPPFIRYNEDYNLESDEEDSAPHRDKKGKHKSRCYTRVHRFGK